MNEIMGGGGLGGLLVLNKPRGMVSKDVSRRLSRYLPKRTKLGHVGTLDPEAEGVLPMVLGQATRVQDYLLALPKTYEFTVQLGMETDSLDLDGEVVRREAWREWPHADVEAACRELVGVRLQRPPVYSAVKHKGRALYDYARAGEEAAIDWSQLSRQVEVYESRLVAYDPAAAQIQAEVRCSKGTYVRVLAQDIAYRLGSCGTVVSLRRTESAGARLAQAFSLEEVEAELAKGQGLGEPYLLPLHKMELGLAEVQLEEPALVRRLQMGQVLSFQPGSFHYDRICINFDKIALTPGSCLVLREEKGRVFGLGAVRRVGIEGVQVVMKRSLV